MNGKVSVKLIIAAIVIVFVTIAIFRTKGAIECQLAQYDLKRDTDYRIVTGRCMVSTPNGKVYLNSLRGWGDNHNVSDVSAQ